MTDRTYLRIYLNDHLAGAVGMIELAKRCRSRNLQTPLGGYLATLVEEMEADRGTLEEVMDRVGAQRAAVKQAAAWVAEKVGRLKLNGELTGYSDLSRLEELETLSLGIEGKRALWEALGQVAEESPTLRSFDFAGLAKRASEQRAELEKHHLEAASRALSIPVPDSEGGPS